MEKQLVPGIKERLIGFLETVLENSKFESAFRPVILNLVKNYLGKASESELRSMLEDMRDKFIPWILENRLPDAKD